MPWPTARNALVRTTAALPTPPRYEYIAVPLAAPSVSSLDRREKLLAERKFPSPLEPDFSKLGLDRLGSMNSDFVCSSSWNGRTESMNRAWGGGEGWPLAIDKGV